ncbi:unnamed protein product [Somion occarium]|uniref:Uncharacterized protein n=1 Tax=Somion occarium TaxID=3059160 RepID=A0ABP1E8M8_9APHY
MPNIDGEHPVENHAPGVDYDYPHMTPHRWVGGYYFTQETSRNRLMPALGYEPPDSNDHDRNQDMHYLINHYLAANNMTSAMACLYRLRPKEKRGFLLATHIEILPCPCLPSRRMEEDARDVEIKNWLLTTGNLDETDVAWVYVVDTMSTGLLGTEGIKPEKHWDYEALLKPTRSITMEQSIREMEAHGEMVLRLRYEAEVQFFQEGNRSQAESSTKSG